MAIAQKSKKEDPSRRTTGNRVNGRAARVVESVLRATGEELSRLGYAALRVEDVAARSGVNKTSIYRRWPTKAALVKAAMSESRNHAVEVDTGSLREDLRASLVATSNLVRDPKWQGVMMILASRADPEVDHLADELRDEREAIRVAIIERGIARGELPAGTNASLVSDLVSGPVIKRLLNFRETIDEDYIDTVLDIVLTGILTVHKRNAAVPQSATTRHDAGRSRPAKARAGIR